VIILTCGFAAAQTPASPSRRYADVIELYRTSEARLPALKDLAALSETDVALGRDALLTAFDSKEPAQVLRAAAAMRVAVLLHTEQAFSERTRGNTLEVRHQINFALVYIERLASRDPASPFVRKWWLMVIAFCHQVFAVADARQFADRARKSVGDSPELYLAMGATDELEWTQRHEADGSPYFKGDLKEAERAYRSALAAQPDLVEARVRLGRVLTLRGDPEAVKVLEGIGDGADEGFRYLARLFEGDDFERRGDLAEAERRYLAAIPLMPAVQSAHVALAHLRHSMGARAKAAEEVEITTRDRVTADTADPWFWYARGMFWHAVPYFNDLLTLARE
jgi:tetratricopeptide (TPR) repeat protein